MKMTLLVNLRHSRIQLSHAYMTHNDYTKRDPAMDYLMWPLKLKHSHALQGTSPCLVFYYHGRWYFYRATVCILRSKDSCSLEKNACPSIFISRQWEGGR